MATADARASPPQLAGLTTSERFAAMMMQRACDDEDALAAPAALATDELRQRLLLAHGSDAEPRALEAAAGQVPSCADGQIAASTAPRGSALGLSTSLGSGLASPPRSPELVAAAARAQGSVEKAEANRDATAVADAFLAARRAARGTDARLPTALLAAAAPLLAPPAPPLPAPVAAEASAAVAVMVPPFASQAEPRVDAGAPLLATMLQQLDCCGWLGPGRIDAETAERLRSDFRPGAAAKALYEAARAFMASPQPELPRDIWCTCIELAKKHTKRGMFAYLQDREKKSKARHETPSAEPYLPPGATQPMLSSKCDDVEVALLTYQQAGWFGPGPAHIGLPVSHLLRRWKNKPAVLSVLHRLPLVASSAEVAAGVPLSSILYEELIQVSRVLWPNEPATRNAAAAAVMCGAGSAAAAAAASVAAAATSIAAAAAVVTGARGSSRPRGPLPLLQLLVPQVRCFAAASTCRRPTTATTRLRASSSPRGRCSGSASACSAAASTSQSPRCCQSGAPARSSLPPRRWRSFWRRSATNCIGTKARQHCKRHDTRVCARNVQVCIILGHVRSSVQSSRPAAPSSAAAAMGHGSSASASGVASGIAGSALSNGR